ncbi:hypothetical protein ACFJIY_11220 [Pimelobacter simplex]|uniref:hypothetical protein n=1 Tax=Nocardioides simplex TaxID=2045 RepID=UPI0036718E8A
MTGPHPALLAKFVRSVALLALPYDSQVAWLASLGMGEPEFADELSLELEDGVRLSRQFEEAGWISSEARQAAVALDALLGEFSGPAHGDFWRLDSLGDSADWARVRELALKVLTAF